MFKLGVITDEISQDLDEALELASHFQLDGVEIRSVWGKNPFQLTLEEAKSIGRAVRARGMQICAVSSPFYKCSLRDEAEISSQMEGLARCAQLCELWETSLIRGFSFWREGNLSDSLPEIVRRFEAPIELLQKKGLTMILESDPSVSACNAGELRTVLDALRSPHVKALWDPGNDIFAPSPERPYPDGYERLRGQILHVHVKDAFLNEKGEAECCRLGEGLADWRGQLRALAIDGYEGYLVMETHYRLGAALSEELMKLPGGAAFSEGGAGATAQCLEILREMAAAKPYPL